MLFSKLFEKRGALDDDLHILLYRSFNGISRSVSLIGGVIINFKKTIIQLFCISLLLGCTSNTEDNDYYVEGIGKIIKSKYSEESVLKTQLKGNSDIIIYEADESIYFFYFLDNTLRNHHRIYLELVDKEGIWWTAGTEIEGDSHVWGIVNKNEEVPVGLTNNDMKFLHLDFENYTIFYIVTEEKINSPIEFTY